MASDSEPIEKALEPISQGLYAQDHGDIQRAIDLNIDSLKRRLTPAAISTRHASLTKSALDSIVSPTNRVAP
jgi:hypothetical protein